MGCWRAPGGCYVNLNPVAATLLAASVLHELRSGLFVLGFAAVAAGVLIVNWTGPRAGEPHSS